MSLSSAKLSVSGGILWACKFNPVTNCHHLVPQVVTEKVVKDFGVFVSEQDAAQIQRTNDALAQDLGISINTVKFHLRNSAMILLN